MDESDKAFKIPKLKGASNYRIWSAEMRAYLEGKGLLDDTIGDEPKPDGPVFANSHSGPGQPDVQASRESIEPLEENLLEKWRRKDARSRSLIMSNCQAHMKGKIVNLMTEKEMWQALQKDYRLASNTSLATYTNRFYSYKPKKDATVDSISNELQDLQSAIFMTKAEDKPTESSKILALLRATRMLNPAFATRIEILEDKLESLDYETTVVALKETESRIKASKKTETEEQSFATNDRKQGNTRGRDRKSKGGQKRKRVECYACGGNHFQRECKEWLGFKKSRDKQQETKGQNSGFTSPLPTPGVKRSN